ncbi:sugar phosphate isomerase/epimerase [bacterium]|nr:sugar phosphate isomerase/epimerase [bacterium]
MRLGRDFTNLLEYEYLSREDREAFLAGKLTVSDMDATVQIKVKADVTRQCQVAAETGLQHVELDGGIPNPYLSFSKDDIRKARAAAEKYDITLSMHLPYTFVSAATCGFQEEDRQAAVAYLKRYLDVAADLGCKFTVMHPGQIPFYQAVGRYLEISNQALLATLTELGGHSDKRNMPLHMENNTFWDGRLYTAAECLPIFEAIRKRGVNIKFCFDLAHEFTGYKTLDEIPEHPEELYHSVPDELYMGIQIGDFIPEGRLFHPPMHKLLGRLKRGHLVEMFRIFQKKGVEYVVIESAVRERDDLIQAFELQAEEARFMRGVFDEALSKGTASPQ